MKLYKGDCLEIMKDIPAGSVDMVLCDLPYGATACKWDSVIPFEQLWKQYKRIIKENGAILLFSAQPFTTKLIHSNIKQYRYNWYWKKNNSTGALFCKHQPMRRIEEVCVFCKRMPTYNPQGLIKLDNPIIHQPIQRNIYNEKKTPSVQKFKGYPNNLLEFNRETSTSKMIHPTQKPVALLEYLIKTYTNHGEVVLDNCMGSGSTGVACVNTGRDFIGIEKDERYFKIAEQRILEAQMQQMK